MLVFCSYIERLNMYYPFRRLGIDHLIFRVGAAISFGGKTFNQKNNGHE